MFYLKCNKGKESEVFYIWANENNMDEWCVSKVPCFFKELITAIRIKNMVEKSSNNLNGIFIENKNNEIL